MRDPIETLQRRLEREKQARKQAERQARRETDCEGARTAAERVRIKISELSFPGEGEDFSITVSIGVAQLREKTEFFSDILELADNALYQAKEGGRNRVVIQD